MHRSSSPAIAALAVAVALIAPSAGHAQFYEDAARYADRQRAVEQELRQPECLPENVQALARRFDGATATARAELACADALRYSRERQVPFFDALHQMALFYGARTAQSSCPSHATTEIYARYARCEIPPDPAPAMADRQSRERALQAYARIAREHLRRCEIRPKYGFGFTVDGEGRAIDFVPELQGSGGFPAPPDEANERERMRRILTSDRCSNFPQEVRGRSFRVSGWFRNDFQVVATDQ
jgi:hypothetical protein